MPKFTPLAFAPDDIVAQMLVRHRRILLCGATGVGKSTLARELARAAAKANPLTCLSCDPGLPVFGPPGAVSLGAWDGEDWTLEAFEPLCSLDAARFRLPLVQAVAKLMQKLPGGTVVIDPPGFMRGMAAAELLTALIDTIAPDAVLLLQRADEPLALGHELAAAGVPVFTVPAPAPRPPLNAAARARLRTRAWDAYLVEGCVGVLNLNTLQLLGAAPPRLAPESWTGHQVAVGPADGWTGFGEVIGLNGDRLELRIVGEVDGAERLLVRDAARDTNRQLRTRRWAQPPRPGGVKQATRAQLELRSGPLVANLVNGVTGDPLLMLRQRHRRGAFLFDLGDSHALSRRLLHTVTDVFVTHAHLDHLAGFPYLLRSRLSAALPPLRLYGPSGIHEHIAGFLAGTRWDRIGEDGPEFEVMEFEGGRIGAYRLKAGRELSLGPEIATEGGLLLRTPELSVRALELDHGIPVLAFAVEMVAQHNVDANQLKARQLPPGPWIGDLKASVRRGDLDASILLPDDSVALARTLAEQLLLTSAGPKIVYATDFADHDANRRNIVEFAAGAALLFCESTFRNADRALAARTQHLTTGACGEIARAAGAERLVPFHFSKRYEGDLATIYREIQAAGGQVAIERHGAV